MERDTSAAVARDEADAAATALRAAGAGVVLAPAAALLWEAEFVDPFPAAAARLTGDGLSGPCCCGLLRSCRAERCAGDWMLENCSTHSLHTRTRVVMPYSGMGDRYLEQPSQKTRPQARQWWRLRNMVKEAEQPWHSRTDESGTLLLFGVWSSRGVGGA